jgi:hypothetical protein
MRELTRGSPRTKTKRQEPMTQQRKDEDKETRASMTQQEYQQLQRNDRRDNVTRVSTTKTQQQKIQHDDATRATKIKKSINDGTSNNVKQADINESIANATRASTTRQHSQEHQQYYKSINKNKDVDSKQLQGPAPQEPCWKQRSKQEHDGIHGGTCPVCDNQRTTQCAGGRC